MSGTDRPVALVTGGGGDIGRAIALKLAQMSAAVAIVDRDEAAARATAQLVEKAGARALAIRADVSLAQDTIAFVEATEARLGPIGIFANNAGIEGVVAPLHEYPDETFDQLLQVNVKGVFLGLKHVIARMMRDGRDHQHRIDVRDPRTCRARRLRRLQARRARTDAHGSARCRRNEDQGQRRSARSGRVAHDPGVGRPGARGRHHNASKCCERARTTAGRREHRCLPRIRRGCSRERRGLDRRCRHDRRLERERPF
ncbi:SDR family NAD(P)-dependent oxidoreductase [Bradyrhizobium sp. BRP20]|nr:SDR family NAD(P)-dependent oxidoreductase [Bradyrhizobium sp. BRP20]